MFKYCELRSQQLCVECLSRDMYVIFMKLRRFDVLVIGGGLAGITATHRLLESGFDVILFDQGLPDARGQLGGFAKFSGAKFSRLPAGQGLIPVAGSRSKLEETTDLVWSFLGFQRSGSDPQTRDCEEVEIIDGLTLRNYESLVLAPTEIDELLERVGRVIRSRGQVKASRIINLAHRNDIWHAEDSDQVEYSAPYVIYAGGRSGEDLLVAAGATAQTGKGVDLGVRVEFDDKRAVSALRAFGPDAKLLFGRARTFCLNSPGRVYRYNFQDISIPGGIVANDDHAQANVGLLLRTAPRLQILDQARRRLQDHSTYMNSPLVRGSPFQDKATLIERVYGSSVAEQLVDFAQVLGDSGMILWDFPHRVHFPLIDWHWNTYAIGVTHDTSLPGLKVVGDCAGHARGLLQAAVSGWLAADEIARND